MSAFRAMERAIRHQHNGAQAPPADTMTTKSPLHKSAGEAHSPASIRDGKDRQAPRADIVLTELEQTFGLAFDSAAIGMAIVALNGLFLRVNKSFSELVGYTLDELTTMTFQAITHPDDAELDVRYQAAILEGSLPFIRREKRYIHKDGYTVWVVLNVALVRAEDGRPLYFVSQMNDISGLKRAEQELRKQAAELSTLHDTTLALLDRQQPDDVLTSIVRSAADLADTRHGYVYVVEPSSDKLVVRVGIGAFADAIGYRIARGDGIAGRAWELGQTVRTDHYDTVPRPRQEYLWLGAAIAVPLMIRDEVIGVIGLAHPIDEPEAFTGDHEQRLTRFAQLASMVLENARMLEDARHTAGHLEDLNRELNVADEIKDQFVAMASHELRTPLTNVIGFTKTLLDHWDAISDHEKREYIEAVDRHSERLYELVSDLLMTSRIESGSLEMKPARIEVLRAIRAASASVPGADLATIACPEDLVVFADPMRVEQILVNYLTNALKHGTRPMSVEARASGNGVVIVVTDNGPGVPESFRPKLFQRFAQADAGLTRRAQGTGLGLSIVRALARAMGGDAWYEPGTPSGSRFCVRLPQPE